VYEVSIILPSPFRLLFYLLGHFFSPYLLLFYSPLSILLLFLLFSKIKAVNLDNLIEAAIQHGLRDKSEINSNPVYTKLKDDRVYK
jgi:hypothetical protein